MLLNQNLFLTFSDLQKELHTFFLFYIPQSLIIAKLIALANQRINNLEGKPL